MNFCATQIFQNCIIWQEKLSVFQLFHLELEINVKSKKKNNFHGLDFSLLLECIDVWVVLPNNHSPV